MLYDIIYKDTTPTLVTVKQLLDLKGLEWTPQYSTADVWMLISMFPQPKVELCVQAYK